MSRALVWTAGLAGAVHAGLSLYWAVGGRWLLATVGQWAVDLSTERPVAAGITLGLVAAATLLGATIPSGRCLRTSALAVVAARHQMGPAGCYSWPTEASTRSWPSRC